ncbi:MAG TPA: hypothetical protein VFK05_28105 [Polyangiaceae bacterium]|nr:hypothetical protein [Polyangiaceae bacterium]
MSFPFKLIVPGAVVALYLASACTPELDTLCADSQCTSSNFISSSTSGGDSGNGDPGGSNGTGDTGGGGGTVLPVCANHEKDSNESDIDCGGSSKCERCAKNASCTQNRDCASNICRNGRCTEPSCDDGIKNQDETGTDCGGICLACDVGVTCSEDRDCTGEYCVDNKCGDHCVSQVLEADETDVDCGGRTCAPCADTKRCSKASDCKSGICSNQKCQVATCNDQIQNQDESDIDCGGACATASKACTVGKTCNKESDCESWICPPTTLKCAADPIVVADDAMIDNFEDGDNLLLPRGTPTRVGTWYAFFDATGGVATMDFPFINRGASLKGVHHTGKSFTNWGSGVGVDLANGSGGKLTWDASAYTGITFWGRAVMAPSGLPVTVAFPDIDTDGLVKNKNCTTCDHHYLKTVQFTSAWQRFQISFSELKTPEPGTIPEPTAFQPGAISSVQFRMLPSTTYELFIDDLGFFK